MDSNATNEENKEESVQNIECSVAESSFLRSNTSYQKRNTNAALKNFISFNGLSESSAEKNNSENSTPLEPIDADVTSINNVHNTDREENSAIVFTNDVDSIFNVSTSSSPSESSTICISESDINASTSFERSPYSPCGKELLFRLLTSEFFSPLIALHYIFKLSCPSSQNVAEINSNSGVIRFIINRLVEDEFTEQVVEFIPQFCHLIMQQSECIISAPIEEFLCAMSGKSMEFLTKTCWYLYHYLSYERFRHRASRLLLLILTSTQNQPEDSFHQECCSILVGTGCLLGLPMAKPWFFPAIQSLAHEKQEFVEEDLIDFPAEYWSISWSNLYSGEAFSTPTECSPQQKFIQITHFVDALHQISKKLSLFPNYQRQQLLTSELNILNYNLPGNFIIPGLFERDVSNWSILRLSSNECATLNSAERVPILIYLEVLLHSNQNESFQSFSNRKIQEKTISTSKEIEHASIMLSQLTHLSEVSSSMEYEKIRIKILEEMENNIKCLSPVSSMHNFHDLESFSLNSHIEPSASILSEDWDEKVARIQATSPFGNLSGWHLCSFIVKSNTDMRQEFLATQLLVLFKEVFDTEGVPCWVYPYSVIVTPSGGLIETVKNSISIHSIKKAAMSNNQQIASYSLYEYFATHFGNSNTQQFQAAAFEFMRSLAGYSLFSYIFQLKDRHNGNILVDNFGHLVHIDFGFFLANAPGRLIAFENAPFKLHLEWCDILDAAGLFDDCKALFYCGMIAIRKHYDRIKALLECMNQADLACFQQYPIEVLLDGIERRLHIPGTDLMIREYVEKLFESSKHNSFTRIYDSYQYYAHGIL